MQVSRGLSRRGAQEKPETEYRIRREKASKHFLVTNYKKNPTVIAASVCLIGWLDFY